MDWDKVLASAPLNRSAAVVTSRNDEPSDFRRKRDDCYHQAGPHPTKPGPVKDPNFHDLTGKRFGRFVVLGLSEFQTHKGKVADKGPLWSVRCDCSYYTLRRSKTLRKTAPERLQCKDCDYAEQVKAGHTHFDAARHPRAGS